MEQFQVLKNTLQYMNWEAKAASYCILKFIYVLLFISITITTIFITITSILLYYIIIFISIRVLLLGVFHLHHSLFCT